MAASHREYLTIVSGLPRSGTSMMMQMLDKGGIPALADEIRKADADNPKGYYEFEPVKQTRKDASWLKDSPGKVVKMVHLLLLDLPLQYQYRVVFMRRNLQEVVASQNIMLQRKGKSSGGLSEDKLTAMFESQIAQVYKYMQDHPQHFKMLEVNYNQMLKEPRPIVESLNTFLDGALDMPAMLAVVDPTLYRNRA